jgi:CheY-like chemotaxis protein
MFSALARPGVVVECVRDGGEALDHFEKYGPSDLLVTAHVLPRLDGPLLVRRLRDAGFGGPVIVAAPAPSETSAYRELRVAAIIPTPISAATLVAAAASCAA